MFTVGVFESSKNWVKCVIFILVSFLMLCMGTLVVFLLAEAFGVDYVSTDKWWLEISQTVQSVIIFLFSALIFAMLVDHNPAKYLYVNRTGSLHPYLLAVIAVMFSQPLVNMLAYYNSLIPLPAEWEAWIKAMEDEALSLTNLFMAGSGTADFLITLFVMAVVPAVVEEFFFRGALFSLCRKLFKNVHVAVWVGAAIFSFIHFQFFGFVPRMFLGALFAYMLVWSGSIWVPVAAHFTNNALAVIAYRMLGEEVANADLQDLVSSGGYYATLVCFTIVFVVSLYYLRKTGKPQAF